MFRNVWSRLIIDAMSYPRWKDSHSDRCDKLEIWEIHCDLSRMKRRLGIRMN